MVRGEIYAGGPTLDAGDPSSSYFDPDGSRDVLGAFGGPQGAWTPL